MKMFPGELDSDVPDRLTEHLFHEFYSEMSEKLEVLHMLLSDYTPKFFDSYLFLRSNANKIFQNFLLQVESVVDEVRVMDDNYGLQGRLFD